MKKPGSKKARGAGTGKRTTPRKRPVASRNVLKTKGKPSRQRSASKSRSAKTAGAKSAPAPRRRLTPEEIEYRNNVRHFENGVKLFNRNVFSKARVIFERITAAPALDLAERAQVYLNICNQRLARPNLRLKTADEYYDYAVSMANQGNQEEAEQYLLKALKLAPQSDYIFYALATTHALRENVEAALQNLEKAIQLNVRNRYLAQNDSDFSTLGEDPRFTELIYPEKPLS